MRRPVSECESVEGYGKFDSGAGSVSSAALVESLGVEETNYLRHVDDVTCPNGCVTRCISLLPQNCEYDLWVAADYMRRLRYACDVGCIRRRTEPV
jgi:hypothetical protein